MAHARRFVSLSNESSEIRIRPRPFDRFVLFSCTQVYLFNQRMSAIP
jgi:hypothetical protein